MYFQKFERLIITNMPIYFYNILKIILDYNEKLLGQ
jgi:hypothetical protein